jgi:hypothetical protein
MQHNIALAPLREKWRQGLPDNLMSYVAEMQQLFGMGPRKWMGMSKIGRAASSPPTRHPAPVFLPMITTPSLQHAPGITIEPATAVDWASTASAAISIA